MAKKKPQPVQMPKIESNVMIIHFDPTKVSLGRLPHISGCGAHRDKRKRRKNTRYDQLKAAVKEWD
jgi:hypothetical protein